MRPNPGWVGYIARPSWPAAGRHRDTNRVRWRFAFSSHPKPTSPGLSMAAKIVRRKDNRAEAETAEKKARPARKRPAAVKKEPAKRKSRAKSAKEVRLKAFWGVFNQSLKRIALYEYSQKKEADKKAKELTASGKSPHFVQPVKEPVVVE